MKKLLNSAGETASAGQHGQKRCPQRAVGLFHCMFNVAVTRRFHYRFRPAIAALGVFVLAACSVTPTALDETEQANVAIELPEAMVARDQESVAGTIDLYEAIARALKYNLAIKAQTRQRLELLSRADLATYSQWPELMIRGGYNQRDNYPGGVSRSILTGQETLTSSTASQRGVGDSGLQFSWSILDFGLSYVRAQQAADQVMVAREEERRITNNLIQEVRSAYWQALTAQRILPKLNALRTEVTQALADAREIESQGLQNPIGPLSYRRNLLEINQRLGELIDELSIAKIQLSSLMNVRPGTEYQLVEAGELRPTRVEVDVEVLEETALLHRPETRSMGYELRIAASEGKAALRELMPGLKFYTGGYYNTNSLLHNQAWGDAGLQVSWNLFNVFRYPSTSEFVEAHEDTVYAQQLSLTMAVIAQVHVALAQHHNAISDFEMASDYFNTQNQIYAQVASSYQTGSITQQQYLFEQLNTLLAELQYDVAYADMEQGFAAVLTAVGVDMLPSSFADANLSTVANDLRNHWGNLASYDIATAAELRERL